MSGLGGLIPFSPAQGGDVLQALRGLAVGGALRGVVLEVRGQLSLQVAGRFIALPSDIDLQAGQLVEILLAQGEDTAQLRVVGQRGAQGIGESPQPSVHTFRLSAGAFEILKSLGGDGPVRGTVVSTNEGLAFEVRGTRIPLPLGLPIRPGLRVELAYSAEDRTVRLTILPQANAPTPASDGLAAVIRHVLQLIEGPSPTRAHSISQVLPRSIPLSESVVRTVVQVLAVRGALGRDLETVVKALRLAESSGIVPRGSTNVVAGILGRIQSLSGRDIAQGLQQWAGKTGSPPEGLLARLLAGMNMAAELSTDRDLRAWIDRWRQNEPLRNFLASRGGLDAFDNAADRASQRLTGAQVQNVRAMEQPYFFIELPVTSSHGMRSGQLHIFGDGGRGGEGFNGAARVVLDLSTTKLGDLWILMDVAGSSCSCQFRATSPEAVSAIEAASDELVAALRDIGYSQARVGVVSWDGDRFEALGDALPSLEGLNVTA